jgi:hypothetical protein
MHRTSQQRQRQSSQSQHEKSQPLKTIRDSVVEQKKTKAAKQQRSPPSFSSSRLFQKLRSKPPNCFLSIICPSAAPVR